MVVRLSDAVRDAVVHRLLPYVVVVNQRPIPEGEGRPSPITIYHHLVRNSSFKQNLLKETILSLISSLTLLDLRLFYTSENTQVLLLEP